MVSVVTRRRDMSTQNETAPQRRRGFASMDSERQREIAAKGGKAAHAYGRAHEFTADEARAAGRKGGESISKDRRHMAEIGRLGGLSRNRNRAAALAKAQAAPTNGSAETVTNATTAAE
jgi:general stress protein YciG